jgi:hypothetical protein
MDTMDADILTMLSYFFRELEYCYCRYLAYSGDDML